MPLPSGGSSLFLICTGYCTGQLECALNLLADNYKLKLTNRLPIKPEMLVEREEKWDIDCSSSKCCTDQFAIVPEAQTHMFLVQTRNENA